MTKTNKVTGFETMPSEDVIQLEATPTFFHETEPDTILGADHGPITISEFPLGSASGPEPAPAPELEIQLEPESKPAPEPKPEPEPKPRFTIEGLSDEKKTE